MITIRSKVKPGDNIYTIIQSPIKKQICCNICEGNGQIVHKNVPIMCPKCKGEPLLENTKYTCWEVIDEPLNVTSISVKYSNPSKYILSYNVGKYTRSIENLFLTKEEAQIRCNLLNKSLVESILDSSIKTISDLDDNVFEIQTKFNIEQSVYTLRKDIKNKKNILFVPAQGLCKIDSLRFTIFDYNNYEVRYQLGKMHRAESRVFTNMNDVILKCNELNQVYAN